MSQEKLRCIVIGGSVGGLAAALEIRRLTGAEVAVYERSGAQLQARGAGVVMQPDVAWLLEQHGRAAEDICVGLRERVRLRRDGAGLVQRASQLMTAWDTLYAALRAQLADVCYRQESELVALDQNGDEVQVAFADGYRTSADFLVAADGINSQCRAVLEGESRPSYAGYVAWRGLEAESDLSASMVSELDGRFTLFHDDGMQFLCYLVPGADGSTEPGRRRVNWVWYINTPAAALQDVMLGTSGRAYASFVPAGDVNSQSRARALELAGQALPSLFTTLVECSSLFVQPVQDVANSQRVFGRCALVGDAAGTVRPHTAAGTAKAFADATLLARTLGGWDTGAPPPVAALLDWERQRNGDTSAIAQMGLNLATNSALGVQNAPQPWIPG